jgi:hypothetical protein
MPISVKPAFSIKIKSPLRDFFLILIVLLCLKMPVFSQDILTYQLRSGQISMAPNLRQDLLDKELKAGQTEKYYYSWIAFERIPDGRSLSYLKQSGAELLEKLSDQVYAVRFKKYPTITQLRTAGIKTVKNPPAQVKLSPSLQQALQIKQSSELIKVSLMLYKNESLNLYEKRLTDLGFIITSRQYIQQGIWVGTIPKNQIEGLAALPFVRHINLFDYKAEPLLQPETGVFGLTLLRGLQPNGRQLSGKGITAGVGDNADPTSHLDLLNNTFNRNPLPLQGANHGTRVSGIITADGLVDDCFTGIAPATRLITDYYDYIITKVPVYKKTFCDKQLLLFRV